MVKIWRRLMWKWGYSRETVYRHCCFIENGAIVFMDDLKLYAKSKEQTNMLLRTVYVFSTDVGMEFEIKIILVRQWYHVHFHDLTSKWFSIRITLRAPCHLILPRNYLPSGYMVICMTQRLIRLLLPITGLKHCLVILNLDQHSSNVADCS